MSPATAIEEMKPTIHLVATFAQDDQANIPAVALPGYAHFLCSIFERLRIAEDWILEHGPKSRKIAEEFRSTYAEWLLGAEIVACRTPWQLTSKESRDDLIAKIEEAKEILADFAVGEAGEKRLAELFREEGV